MFSLYPSHIPISFPSPYIPHIHKSFIIFACCPATCFFHFSFFLYRGRNRMSWCVFLVVFGVGIVDGFRLAFHSAPRPAFPVSFLVPPFGPFFPFRSSPRSSLRSSVCPAFRLFRLVVSGGCVVGRFVWSGAVGLSLVVAGWRGVRYGGGVCCVRRFCQLVFVGACWRLCFLSVFLVWRLVCSACFGGAGGALPHSLRSSSLVFARRFARLRSSLCSFPFVASLVVGDGMRFAVWCRLVPCRRLVSRLVSASCVGGRFVSVLSYLRRFCQLGFPCLVLSFLVAAVALFVFVSLGVSCGRRVWRRVVGAC